MPDAFAHAPSKGTMLTVRVEHEGGAVSIYEGTVLEREGGRVAVLFDHPVCFGRAPVDLQYMSGSGEIIGSTADASTQSKDQPATRGVFELRGDAPRPIARRESAVLCDTPEEKGCPVVRLGTDRITIRTTTRPSAGDRLRLTLRAGGDHVTSVFVVRQRKASQGAVSVDLEAEAGERAVRGWLASRIGGSGAGEAMATVRGGEPVSSSGETDGDCIQLNIPVRDLVGRTLPFEVLDEQGETIAGPSTVISEEDVERLAGMRAFPQTDWLDVLEEELVPEGQKLDGDERRAFPRYAFRPKGMAQVVGETDRRKLKIQMIDVSRSGLSFYTSAHIAPGTPLMVLIESRGGKYWILSRAVHCRVDERKGFRVGVRYEQGELNSLDRVA